MTTNDTRWYSVLLLFGVLLVTVFTNKGIREDFAGILETAENRYLMDASSLEGAWNDYALNADRAIGLIEDGRYREGVGLLNANLREFEWYLDHRGSVALSTGKTLSQEHKLLKYLIRSRLEPVYQDACDKVARGDFSPMDMRTFLNFIPFEYQNRFSARWKQAARDIEAQRAERASNWIFVSVHGSLSDGWAYERKVHEWLRSNVSGIDGYKMVFGSPMGERDAAAAFRHISILMDGEFVWYQFDQEAGLRGSREVYETIHVSSRLESAGNSVISTTWDTMEPLKVHVEAPETVQFEFTGDEAREPDFEPFIRKQRSALVNALGDALASWPALELIVSQSGEMATASR